MPPPSTSPPRTTTTITTPSKPTTFTLRNPPHTYLHLRLTTHSTTTSNPSQPLDEITLRTHLTAALTQYLGLTGTAIPVDIFKVESAQGEAWVRVPRDDEGSVVAALSQWVGRGGVVVRVLRRGSWLGGLIGGDADEEV